MALPGTASPTSAGYARLVADGHWQCLLRAFTAASHGSWITAFARLRDVDRRQTSSPPAHAAMSTKDGNKRPAIIAIGFTLFLGFCFGVFDDTQKTCLQSAYANAVWVCYMYLLILARTGKGIDVTLGYLFGHGTV